MPVALQQRQSFLSRKRNTDSTHYDQDKSGDLSPPHVPPSSDYENYDNKHSLESTKELEARSVNSQHDTDKVSGMSITIR